ncbi:MAG TPA: sigma 54-interacting transcriptional regulator [Polyangiaceae bacterium]|jgi:DNA-binding NtrC family response regulator
MSGFDDEQSTVLSSVEVSPPAEAVFRVSVIEGPDRGAHVVVDGGGAALLVGQSPVCALRLSDTTASRRHLEIEIASSRLRVRDLDSSNGTYVGALRIVEAHLEGGEIMLVGTTRLHVERVVGAKPARIVTEVSFGDVRGISREMRRLFPLFARLAQVDVPVLVEGETGTGKEVLARALHTEGSRKDGPFVVFDCTTIAAQLLESELFGHERGAFTGAIAQRRGVFEQAAGGTLFIDEIGDLPLDLQPKLLRALERSEVRRVGSDKWIHCDVRVVAATRRNIEQLVQEGRFRDDLFHRLAVGRVELPPLRRRRGDVLALIEHFCTEAGASARSVPAWVISEWMHAEWPGNVRQLRNAVQRELALGALARVEVEPSESPPAADDDWRAAARFDLPFVEARERVIDAFQREYLARALEAAGGSAQRAAEAAGIAPRYFRLLRARARPPKKV